jgi:hypothetical protein
MILERTAIVAVIVGLGEVAKMNGLIPKFVPILNLTLGVVAGILYSDNADITIKVFEGLMMGLMAGGLYSGVKNVNEGVQELRLK